MLNIYLEKPLEAIDSVPEHCESDIIKKPDSLNNRALLRELMTRDQITNEDAKRLAAIYKSEDPFARNIAGKLLIKKYEKLVLWVYERLTYNRTLSSEDKEDCLSAATSGLLRAAEAYDSNLSENLSTHLTTRVKNAIREYFLTIPLIHIPEVVSRSLRKQKIEQSDTSEEESNELQRVRNLLKVVSLDEPTLFEDVSLRDTIHDNSEFEKDVTSKMLFNDVILDKLRSLLSKNEFKVLASLNGLENNKACSSEELALSMKCSVQYITNCKRKARTKILRNAELMELFQNLTA